MRYHKFLTAGTALMLATGVVACDEGLTEINQNPNEPETVAPQYLLADAQVTGIGGDMGTHGVWVGLYLNNIWPQHLAQIQYNDEDHYTLRPNVVAAFWNDMYARPLTNLKVMKETAAEEGVPNQAAVAEILSQYFFQVLTDHYGPIPYTEALAGLDGVIAPKFDDQETVYNGMLSALTAASSQIQPGGSTPFAAGDLMYKGDMAKWRKFSNSLRMRMAMRISDVAAAKARQEFVAAYNAGGFTSNADNAQLVWGSSINSQNAHYDIFFNQDRRDFVVSATTVDTLKSLSDPRLEIYADPAASDKQYRGLRNGLYPNQYTPSRVLADFSMIGSYFLQPTSPSMLMSYSELLFLQAEAASKGWINANAAALYTAAVTASLQQYSVPAAEIAAYLAQPRVAPSANAATLLQQIYLQKWIALYMNGPEAYAEIRRTETPALQLAAGASLSTFPKRVPYPTTEQTLNKENYSAAVATLGADDQTRRVWWDVR